MKPKNMEVYFNIAYLLVTFCLGIFLILFRDDTISKLWGLMALILVGGDSFHLVPRVLSAFNKDKDYTNSLGRGKQITSISMTIFYVILWQIGLMVYNVSHPTLSIAVYILAVIRVLLCLFPQNGWTEKEPSYKWGIYRNIPFALIGIIVTILFGMHASIVPNFRFMAVAIVLSFSFYIPVVLYSSKKPMVGMLMLPKTLMYVWIILMGL